MIPDFLDLHACVTGVTEWRESLPPRISAEIREALGGAGNVAGGVDLRDVPEQTVRNAAAPNSSSGCCVSVMTDAACISADDDPSAVVGDTLHFFAVYDGHGGGEVRASGRGGSRYHCVNMLLLLHRPLSSAQSVSTSTYPSS